MTGTFVFVLDFFVVNVALPSIQHGLHASAGAIEWIVAAYAVSTAALLLAGGRVGDRLGARRAFGIGLGAFTAASAACAVAPTAAALVAARVAQGFAAAVMAPAILSILSHVYTGEHRARAISVYGMVMGLAAVSGQLIGGSLIGAGLGWRSVFWVNVPVGVIGVLLLRVIPAVPASRSRHVDMTGVVLLAAGLVAVVLPLVDGRQHGWPLWSWLLLAAAPVLLALFGGHQHRLAAAGGNPLLAPSLLRQPGLATGLVTQMAYWCQQAASYLFLAIYLQAGRGLSPFASGLVFTALAAGYLLTSAKAPQLTQRYGRTVLLAGALVAAVGDLALAGGVYGGGHAVVALLPGLVLLGAGQGLCITPLTATVLAYATPATQGAVTGAVSTMQQVGNAVGVGLIGVVFFDALAHGYTTAFADATVAMAVVLVAVAALTRSLPRQARPDEPVSTDGPGASVRATSTIGA